MVVFGAHELVAIVGYGIVLFILVIGLALVACFAWATRTKR